MAWDFLSNLRIIFVNLLILLAGQFGEEFPQKKWRMICPPSKITFMFNFPIFDPHVWSIIANGSKIWSLLSILSLVEHLIILFNLEDKVWILHFIFIWLYCFNIIILRLSYHSLIIILKVLNKFYKLYPFRYHYLRGIIIFFTVTSCRSVISFNDPFCFYMKFSMVNISSSSLFKRTEVLLRLLKLFSFKSVANVLDLDLAWLSNLLYLTACAN